MESTNRPVPTDVAELIPAATFQRVNGPKRRFLVYVRAGRSAMITNWYKNGSARSWDLMLSFYEEPEVAPLDEFEFIAIGGVSKFTAVSDLMKNTTDYFLQYEAVFFLDDDIIMEFHSVDDLFRIFMSRNLSLAQPALSQDSFASWPITKVRPEYIIRYTNFVEVMMPIMSRNALQVCASTFSKSLSSWGIDYVWASFLQKSENSMAIVDAVVAHHPNPIDLRKGRFYEFLRTLRVDPIVEAHSLMDEYGICWSKVREPLTFGGIWLDGTEIVFKGNIEEVQMDTNDDLTALAIKYGTDKWGAHFYTPNYHRHFKDRRNERITLMEIGIGGYNNISSGGASLRMWKEYFPAASIIGLDIYEKTSVEEDRIKTFVGSQTDGDVLCKIILQSGGIDIIIDDGSHINSDVIRTFEYIFPMLNQNGIYVVEDVQTSYWPGYGGDSKDLNKDSSVGGYFKKKVDGLNHAEFDGIEYLPNYFDLNISGIHFYHNMIFVYKGSNRSKSNVPKQSRQP